LRLKAAGLGTGVGVGLGLGVGLTDGLGLTLGDGLGEAIKGATDGPTDGATLAGVPDTEHAPMSRPRASRPVSGRENGHLGSPLRDRWAECGASVRATPDQADFRIPTTSDCRYG
jgi:hypothetical protein